jgi:hypothetical protein
MFGLNAKQIFMLLLLILALYAGSQLIPAYFNAFQFNDYIKQEVRFAVANRRTGDALKAKIVEKAHEYDIPVRTKDIRITRRGPSFTLELDYLIPVDLRFYKRDINFHVSESGELFDQ